MKHRQISSILAQQNMLKQSYQTHTAFEPDHQYRLQSMELLVRIQQERLDAIRKPCWGWLVELEKKRYENTHKR